ncbi:hypothetical protein HanRHA438_Chr11g0486001 [Helianthus annuus]|uniref:ZCF37 n=1 Tax=Helianthus annuus TaxID=4232 RepID=A0A251VE07_HELAN|nr:uncharacterized protein LOC110888960 [Helianthus annuus]KAF5780489.1 hypothetical protein HanXRQr2_Chr11g0472461 [Helianthus annuus]KAJ0500294.1 hypothetical protein HanHA300_Chr11g0387991 [Helianthus annuus]KAJ0507692.1 hypothetical protein HanIR_Chr11g0509021 [Helianthus annuus]KAJ0516128.1 hypothetical protein HanHA89_Chr11g0410381 [Helianthus annuus]KAJ0684155.1 hypothetical protein HanLR1_Chr11g0388081 [Helianthus annuus]
MAFICGSFHSQEEDNYDVVWPFSSPSTRKSTRRRHIFGNRRNKIATNPYANCGLDKYEALLAELDQKRQKFLAQKRYEDVSMVKFIYNSTNELEPVVIKLQDEHRIIHHNTSSLSTPEVDHKKDVSFSKAEEDNTKPVVHDHTEKFKLDQSKRKIVEWWKPCYYFPLFVILILVLLMFSGRSFAILCTSIGWYLVPEVNENLHNPKQPNNIKELKE